MSGLKVRVGDFEDGTLPPVCVVTGEAAEVLQRFALSSPRQRREGLLWWFIGGPIGILALWWTRLGRTSGEVVGYVPLTRGAAATSSPKGPSGPAFVAGGLACLLLALVAAPRSGVLGGLWVPASAVGSALLVASLAVAARRDATIPSVEVDESGRWVTIRPVSPRFAAAYEAQERDRQSSRPQDPARVALPRSG